MTGKMDMASILGLMGVNILVIFQMIINMDMEK